MTSVRGWLTMSAMALTLGGCAAAVTPVVAVPGPNKDVAAFRKDDSECRKVASQAAYGTVAPPGVQAGSQPNAETTGGANAQWKRYFESLTQCSTAHGDAVAAVPWTAAFASYLGYGYPYPAGYVYPGAFAYPYAYGYPFFPGYYAGFYGFGFAPYGYGYFGHGWGYYHGGWRWRGGGGGGFHGGFGGFHGGAGFHH